MKVALTTDTHWGIRNDSPVFAKVINKFFTEQFFPYIDQHNIQHVIHLGDVFDRRKYVNFQTIRNFYNDFMLPCKQRNLGLDIMVGNHDTYYKNTNEINSMHELFHEYPYDKLNLYYNATNVKIDGTEILFVPWICKDNYDHTMQTIEETTAQICFGHLELDGFELQRGYIMDHGMSPKIFGKFDLVCSGHYHHKSNRGNVHYLGTAYELFWSDWNDPKGFHVFDTDTRELEFIENPNKLFHKVWYDDMDKTVDQVLDVDFDMFKDSFVKVIVTNKTSPYWFDLFASRIDNAGPANVQVVDDHLNLDIEDDSDIIDQAEDTMTILRKYVDSLENAVDKDSLHKVVGELYNEALMIQ